MTAVSPQRRAPGRLCPSLFRGLAVAILLVGSGDVASAAEMTSANFRHRAGTFASSVAAGSGALTPSMEPSPVSSSGVTIGGGAITAPVGSGATLTTVWAGFWTIVSGGFPSLDLDGDVAQFFLDPDDDGDGLEDIHETGTGFFVSATNTGTSPTRADTDGDGIDDGAEVLGGTDPNDPLSGPPPPAVPSLQVSAQILLLGLLVLTTVTVIGLARRRSLC